MLFVCKKDNRIEKVTKLNVSANRNEIFQNMKDDYYDIQKKDKKEKRRHQFSQSKFSTDLPYGIIFYPNQTKISWEMRDYEYDNTIGFSKNIEKIINDTVFRLNTTYKTLPKVSIISCDENSLTALIEIHW